MDTAQFLERMKKHFLPPGGKCLFWLEIKLFLSDILFYISYI
ncbi:hypothetical protein KNP414_01850 [Paenibacillus mucilaginosus KNP414]|uniref:Uncharacterized protein n=1 Tax=Paenibacillus mucilaginosus (strain KNP414) TaxID=1036673 RepID=F8FQQ7_PAEMK|nr:hypothetical protein KNP414_01850 [Paenibacillus mucilaginosus KNP414]